MVFFFFSFIKFDGSFGKYGGESHRGNTRGKKESKKRLKRRGGGKLREAFVYFALILSFSSLFVLLYF
jgi:hypothetical protein